MLVALGLAAAPVSASAQCLGVPEARMMIRSGTIIPLLQAIAAARASTGGEVIDSRLCGSPGSYRYVITFLGQDGRVVRVTVDARTGAVLGVK